MDHMPIVNIFLGGKPEGKKEEAFKKAKETALSKLLKEGGDEKHSEVMGGFNSLLTALNGLPHQEHSGGAS